MTNYRSDGTFPKPRISLSYEKNGDLEIRSCITDTTVIVPKEDISLLTEGLKNFYQTESTREIIMQTSLELVAKLHHGISAILGGYTTLIYALAKSGNDNSELFREIYASQEQFESLMSRLKPTLLFEQHPPIPSAVVGAVLDNRS